MSNNKDDPIYIRKLKPIGRTIKPGQVYLHPVTLELRVHNENFDVIATQPYYNPESKTFAYEYKSDVIANNKNVDLRKFMSLPYLNLDINYMLHLYNINDIDQLQLWLDKEIKKDSSFIFINRILNIWIKFNLEDLQKNYNILVPIYKKIGTKYWSKYMDKNDSENKMIKFISDWINNIEIDDFFFDLGNDLRKYIKNLPS